MKPEKNSSSFTYALNSFIFTPRHPPPPPRRPNHPQLPFGAVSYFLSFPFLSLCFKVVNYEKLIYRANIF